MPGLILREQLGVPLTKEQADQNWKSLYRPPTLVIVSGGVLTLSGQGNYAVRTEGNAATDEVTSVVGLPAGEIAILQAEVTGQVSTFIHSASLRLGNGASYSLETKYTTLVLRSDNGTILYQCGGLYVP